MGETLTPENSWRFENFLGCYVRGLEKKQQAKASLLTEAMSYSLFSGGKRFRPMVGYAVAEALGCEPDRVTPFLAAIEFIHTYSLIHDDLPALDNDNFRRDKPTNHRVFGEANAILAGDALLTEAFHILAESYSSSPAVGLRLVQLTSEAAGVLGMVGGQVMDMQVRGDWTLSEYKAMHELKTGALIRLVAEGVSVVAGAEASVIQKMRNFGERLGLAFQLADDLIDVAELQNKNDFEKSGFPRLLGLEATRKLLNETTAEALSLLNEFGDKSDRLKQIALYNSTRTQ